MGELNGPWRSLVARFLGVEEVPSSNLGGPTNVFNKLRPGVTWPSPVFPHNLSNFNQLQILVASFFYIRSHDTTTGQLNRYREIFLTTIDSNLTLNVLYNDLLIDVN